MDVWLRHFGNCFLIFPDIAPAGFSLALIFTLVGIERGLIHLREDDLADAAACGELDRERVGVEDLQRDFAFKSRVDPSGVLDEESHTADGATAFDEGGHIVRQADDLYGRGEDEGFRRDDNLFPVDFTVVQRLIHGDDFRGVLVQDQEVRAEAEIDGGRLDLVVFNRRDGYGAVGQVGSEGGVGEDHRG